MDPALPLTRTNGHFLHDGHAVQETLLCIVTHPHHQEFTSMTRLTRSLPFQALALAVTLGTAVAAQAQTTMSSTPYDANRTSWIPYTNNGYFGINVGRSDFQTSCGALALRCDNSDSTGKIYLGGLFNPYFGAEVGYSNPGNVRRAGGTTEAHGINLSLVGRLPLGSQFSLYGKLGANYGRTRVSSAAGTGIASGRENGWGPTYAIGASWDFATNWSAVLEADRTRYDFAGNNRDWVRTTSVGLQYRF